MAIKVSGTEVISDDKRILNNEDLPDIRPSLLLDFANSKTLDPRITFTRGSTATYYDGKTTAKAEENLLSFSQEFDNSYWTAARLDVTANATTAPDGTTTADAINQASGETNHGRLFRSTVPNSAGVTTVSIYAKANTRNFLAINTKDFINTAFNYTWFNLSTGAVGTTNSGHTASITDVGNGWYRCSLTFTSVAPDPSGDVGFVPADTDGSLTVTDDQKGIYIWGAQLEQRSSATAYTPTTSSPIVKYQPVLQTAASGEARFDHDPVTGGSKGLLIEESRTNLYEVSVPTGLTRANLTTNTVIAPDGTLTAAKLSEDTQDGTHYAKLNTNIPSDAVYTLSFFIKAAERTNAQIWFGGADQSPQYRTNFNLTDGTFTELSPSADSSTMDDVGNGWYRCSMSATVNASTSFAPIIALADDSGEYRYIGDGYSGIYVWGAQFEQGSFPTSYIPTSGSTVTRDWENSYIDGADFNDFYSAGQGALYAEYIGSLDTFCGVAVLQSTFNNINSRISLLQVSAITSEALVSNSFVTQAQFNNNTVSAGLPSKVVVSYTENDVGASMNGNIQTDTSAVIPSDITALRIGGLGGGNHLNSTIKKIAFYPKRLPNATLQAMTEA